MKTKLKKEELKSTGELTLSRSLASEEIRCGDYVSVFTRTIEFPSFMWGECSRLPPDELVRLKMKPADSGNPLLVKEVCLPFVAVVTPQKRMEVLDTRVVQLVRLSASFGKIVAQEMGKQKTEEFPF
ncbi:hypothetical protein SH668x_002014 [Planctomicrobium sp. SH668]|uniref:hypothetical protein n=1 Tax=Planctomicrobium sp. SH668 TaxID=3448126 RepID=UPI003F5B20BA